MAFASRLEEVLNVNFSLTATFRSITQDHRNEAWISEVEIASADQPAPGGTGNWPDRYYMRARQPPRVPAGFDAQEPDGYNDCRWLLQVAAW